MIEALLGNAMVVAIALILGGVAILVIERLAKQGDIVGVAEMPVKTGLGIGFVQCLAMIPGVSRSGATIMGGLSLGVERRTAAEFSFFLAIPTMLGATTLELVKHRDDVDGRRERRRLRHDRGRLRRQLPRRDRRRAAFVAYISRHGFAPFAWYRIVGRRGRAGLADDALSLFRRDRLMLDYRSLQPIRMLHSWRCFRCLPGLAAGRCQPGPSFSRN